MVSTPESISKIAKKYQNKDYDFVVAISGFTGRGKSVLANKIAKHGNGKHHDFLKHNIYSKKDFYESLKNFPEKSFINVDEAINVLFRREFYRGDQIAIVKLLDRVRFKKHCIILSLPVFWDIDKKVLPRINIWIYVDKRGTGYIFQRDENPFTTDPWHRKQNEKLLSKWSGGEHPYKCPNYLDSIKFSDLDPDDKKIYLEVQAKKKLEATDDDPFDEVMKRKIRKEAVNESLRLLSVLKQNKILRKGYHQVVAEYLGIKEDSVMKKIRRLKDQDKKKKDNRTALDI